MNHLWDKDRYSAKIEFIIDNFIREYDITKANISVLRDANVLSEEQYMYFMSAPKMEREVAIGKMQGSNTKITEILKSGIKNAKRVFMESNDIQDSEILYIRNDAIAVIGSRPIMNLQITDRVAFRESARYSSFYKFNYIDLLYLYDVVENKEHLDIKGLGDSGVSLHKDFMIDFLCELFYSAQNEGAERALNILSNVHEQYIKLEMPAGYYREFNPQSKFKLSKQFSMVSSLYLDNINEHYKQYLDISFNEYMLRHFSRIYSSIYFNKAGSQWN